MQNEIHQHISNIENELAEISNVVNTNSKLESVTLNNTEYGIRIEIKHEDGTITTYTRLSTE